MSHTSVATTDVPTATNAVQLSSGRRRVRRIYFKAHEGNTGDVYLGDSTVSSTNGISLDQARPGTDWHTIDYTPSSESEDYFYVDAATNGDDLDWLMVFVESGTKE